MSIEIGRMEYDGKLVAGKTATLKVTFTKHKTSIAEKYKADIYIRKNGSDYYKTTEYVYFSARQTQETVTFRFKLYDPGEIYTIVNISDNNGQLLVSRKGKYSDKVESSKGGNDWEIKINLPENRYNTGTLKFYVDGDKVHSCDCLGRGTNDCSSSDSWKKEDGNTPTGVAEGILYSASSKTDVYGPNKRIYLHKGISGNFKKALTTYGRSELMIHGGRSQSKLWNTNGCIRIFDRDMETIVNYIENCREKSGIVTISEY